MNPFYGVPVVVSPFVPVTTEMVQRRSHRTARINKKWRKRYGVRSVKRHRAILIGGQLWMHPENYKRLAGQITNIGDATP